MNISLLPDLEEMVNRKVKSGEYDSPSEVVVHALYLLEACDRFREAQLDALRREVAIGIQQSERGEVAEFDIEEIIGAARRQLAMERGYSQAK
jgi:antitoxin ParD1/3/4